MEHHTQQKQNSRRPWVIGALAAALLLSFWYFSSPSGTPAPEAEAARVTKAVAVLKGKVAGTVTLSQPQATAPVQVSGQLKGLKAGALRGFHVHQFGDISDGCAGAGAHFNPFGRNHGAPNDKDRHVGDLGNVLVSEDGTVDLKIEDSQLTLNGPYSILGRAIVVHDGTDDLGRGGNPDSKKTGNAGGRDACGIIAVAN
ncbi:Cu/Zn superoxide dismutase [Auricularia subglabra TFB-10046 SS5]|nr:Cu/Zn superoxide dismutase [Auricularia subglabra TFB-10046 SS5]